MVESHQSPTTVPGSSPVSSDPARSAISSHYDKGSAAKSDGTAGDRATGAQTLSDLKDKIADAHDTIKTKYRIVSESTDDYVHETPWKAVAMALIGGLIVGMLARR